MLMDKFSVVDACLANLVAFKQTAREYAQANRVALADLDRELVSSSVGCVQTTLVILVAPTCYTPTC